MKKIAIIMRAIPGSGKSTFASMLKNKAIELGLSCSIHSSDEKFMQDGKYNFSFALLGRNHRLTHDEFCQAMQNQIDVVISDNTNIKHKDYIRYVNSAKEANYKVIAVSFVPMESVMHFNRNVHSVPIEAIDDMKKAFNINTESVDQQYFMECSDGFIHSEFSMKLINELFA